MISLILLSCLTACADEPALTPKPTENLQSALSNQLLILNVSVSQRAPSVDLFSKRGDVHLFLGRFPKAVADYQEMAKLDPRLQASNWRLGIALYYDGKYQAAADQFSSCHKLDDVDRENGIWRYFSQWKASGKEEARKQLIQYEKEDREPFGDIYQLISGDLKAEELLSRIKSAKISDAELQKRMFYAELYIGMNESLNNNPDSAKEHFQAAVDNKWPQQAGYGPNYMWHVARLQLQLSSVK